VPAVLAPVVLLVFAFGYANALGWISAEQRHCVSVFDTRIRFHQFRIKEFASSATTAFGAFGDL
jgi:hypothetical protein